MSSIKLHRLSICTILCGVLGLSTGAAHAQTATYQFDLPAQPLADALRAVGRQTSKNILFDPALVERITAPALRAQLTLSEAVNQLLAGTRLSIRDIPPNTLVVQDGASAGSVSTPLRADETAAPKTAEETLRLTQAASSSASAQKTPSAGSSDSSPSRSGSPTDAANDSGSRGIQEIIVTAQKRAERIQDVPISIAVMTGQDIERRGFIGMEDYLRAIPGVSQIDRGGIDNTIVIRGISVTPQNENLSTGGPTAASYFDEVLITSAAGKFAGGIDVRPVDIERIEVLRGPQGTTFGAAALGGAVRMIPVKPKLDGFGARLAGNYSNTGKLGGDNSMIQGMVNLPVLADKVAIRAVAYRYDESGFFRNVAGVDPGTLATAATRGLTDYVSGFVQDDVGRMTTVGGRFAALWQATDRLQLSVNFLTQRIEQDGDPTATVGPYEQARIPVDPRDRVRGEEGGTGDTHMDLASAVLSYDLGWSDLTAIGSWINSGSDWSYSADRVGILNPSSRASGRDKYLTGEVRLASKFTGRLQFLGGLFAQEWDDASLQVFHWPGTPAQNFWVTDPQSVSLQTFERTQNAIFGEVSYGFTEKLTLSLGGRYFEYEERAAALVEGGILGVPGGIPLVPLGAGVPVLSRGKDQGSTYKAQLAYKPTSDGLLYASWAQGYRIGPPDGPGVPAGNCDIDNDGRVDNTNVTLESTKHVDPDELDSYELGAKFAFMDGRLALNASVYHIDWTGVPVRVQPTFSTSLCTFTANAGEATSEGMDLQLSFLATPGLRIDMSGGYTDAKLSKDVPAQGWRKGDRLPASPKLNANLGAQYEFDLASHRTFVRADTTYVGDFYGDLLETPGLKAGDYIQVDARAGVAIKKASVELFVHNLTNEDAYTWRGIGGSASGAVKPFYGYRLQPRTVGIQLTYDFD